jgi:hypothetical protein
MNVSAQDSDGITVVLVGSDPEGDSRKVISSSARDAAVILMILQSCFWRSLLDNSPNRLKTRHHVGKPSTASLSEQGAESTEPCAPRASPKRGGAAACQGASPDTAPAAAEPSLDQSASPEPTPEFAAQFADECQRLFNLLGEGELRSIAQWKMAGI